MLATTAPSLDDRVATAGVRPTPALLLPPLVAVKLLDQVRERLRQQWRAVQVEFAERAR